MNDSDRPTDDPFAHCAAEVRLHDHDRFLCSLFAPADRRGALHALLAFNLEVARTREAVSEAMLGQIRLQWWREAIAEIYEGRPRRHYAVQALAAAVEKHDLARAPFDRLIDARERDLVEAGPKTLDALVAYAEATSATLVEQSLAILGVRDGPAIAAGRELGIAWALTGLLRALPFHARAKRLYLPADLIADAGLSLSDLFELRSSAALRQVAAAIADAARTHLAAARGRRGEVRRAARAALLPATLAAAHLRRLERAGHDPFAPRLATPLASAPLRLTYAALTGRY